MADIYDVMWPSEVPRDLWNLPARGDVPPILPFMDISIQRDFIIAAIVGAGILVLFGGKRFNKAADAEDESSNRVLAVLAPMRMRGQRAMTWAYTAYISLMLGIFIALTFFGELILTLSTSLPIAGIQVDANTLNLDTPGWPLTLALGFAGLAPIFPPVAALETWMRTVVHSGFGIPARLKEHTEKLISDVSDFVREKDAGQGGKRKSLPPWLDEHLQPQLDQRRAFRLMEELKLFAHWNSEPLGWPKLTERRDLARLQSEIVHEARLCIEEFGDVIDLAAPQEAKKPQAETFGFVDPQTPFVPESGRENNGIHGVTQRKRLEQRFDRVVERMEILRNELATIMSLYAERDNDFDSISHKPMENEPELRRLLSKVFPETHASSPVPGLLWIAPLILLGLALAVQFRYVSPLASVPLTTTTILMSAFLYLLNYLAVIVLPSMATFYWRYRLIDIRQWSTMPWGLRSMFSVGIAFLVAASASFVLAVFWNALISQNGEQLRQKLFDVNFPNALFHISMAVIGAWVVMCALVGEEIARSHAERLRTGHGKASTKAQNAEGIHSIGVGLLRILVGAGAALGTAALVFGHRAFWGYTTWASCRENGENFFRCQLESIGPDMVVFPIAAFLACTSLMHFTLQDGPRSRVLHAAAFLLPAFLVLTPLPATAQGEETPDQVVVGFRADAEPFVYRVNIDGEKMYTGYLADLCFSIFDNTRYEMLTVEVTAANRFEALLKPGDFETTPRDLPSAKIWRDLSNEERLAKKVDVVCDPITLRYDESDPQRTAGIFSPILFASGVSYLETNKSQAGGYDPYLIASGSSGENSSDPTILPSHDFTSRAKPVLIGYIENSTAADVAEELCASDHFGVRPRASARLNYRSRDHYDSQVARLKEGESYEKCGAASAKLCDPKDLTYDQEGESLYRFCVKQSHRDLIAWFCDESVSAYHHVYLGDRDLILGKIATWREEHGTCGQTEVIEPQAFFTYEPYALLVTQTRPALVQHVQRRVYEFFSDRDGAIGQFIEHFPGQRMSPALAYLHLINAVSRPGLFKFADLPNGDD